VRTGGANSVVLVIAELVPLSPDGFIGDHTLMLGNQKAEDGHYALGPPLVQHSPTSGCGDLGAGVVPDRQCCQSVQES
jgi:hypothetical protein